MKLQHTLGGLEGLDPVVPELRVFVEPWEERIFGIHAAMMALSPQLNLPQTSSTFHTVWTWADLRKGAEAMNPFDYFKYRYYEKWLGGISAYLVATGYITQAELDARTDEYLADPSKPLPSGGTSEVDDRIHKYLMDGDSPWHQWADKPRFAVGDTVLVADPPTVEHTRLPGYLRNKVGVVETVYADAFSYLCSTGPDGIGPPMPVYCVKFDPQHLWPGNAEPGFFIYADLFDSYVRPLEGRSLLEGVKPMTDRFAYPDDREKRNAARVRALEALLIEKGVITDQTVDKVMQTFATEMGPFNGAKLVAKAWVDDAFKALLVTDTMAAVAQLGLPTGAAGAEGEHMRAVANTPQVHNLIICTSCSCYPWPVLGLPPYWYKDPSFRARAAREPRAVLKEFGLDVGPSKEIRTWDSSAQIRWFVVPERPDGTQSMSEDELAKLVTPEAMMGVALALPKAA